MKCNKSFQPIFMKNQCLTHNRVHFQQIYKFNEKPIFINRIVCYKVFNMDKTNYSMWLKFRKDNVHFRRIRTVSNQHRISKLTDILLIPYQLLLFGKASINHIFTYTKVWGRIHNINTRIIAHFMIVCILFFLFVLVRDHCKLQYEKVNLFFNQ